MSRPRSSEMECADELLAHPPCGGEGRHRSDPKDHLTHHLIMYLILRSSSRCGADHKRSQANDPSASQRQSPTTGSICHLVSDLCTTTTPRLRRAPTFIAGGNFCTNRSLCRSRFLALRGLDFMKICFQ